MPIERTSEQTPASLGKINELIEKIAARIQAVGAMMDTESIPSMIVSHFTALEQGLQKLQSFASAAEQALEASKLSRGQFGTPQQNNRTPADTGARKKTTYDKKIATKSDTREKPNKS